MRHADWVPQLRDALLAQSVAPFSWGLRDCCLAAGDVVAAIGDIDPVAPFRPVFLRCLVVLGHL